MPRGKFVNHKGRSRQFTSPEELRQESEEDGDQTSGSGAESETKAGGSAGAGSSKAKAPVPHRLPVNRNRKSRSAAGAASSSASESGEASERDSESQARNAKKGVASLIEIENPNRVTKKVTQKLSAIKLNDGPGTDGKGGVKPELSRREREQKGRQHYDKLHGAGETAEAKADLARLALIRQKREEAAAKREADKKAAEVRPKKTGAK
ncbi:28 kDa heat- and acid-stable phosphoprotein-like [Drosophila eugracilis]|uniref:28 kDa heat- and acid-stable phosphoprotein-like n=1 Tax=Drosophila eugracilis TaxID=29029 RepID=UPI001BDADCEF|nr:28 kDa heat- and acid-stable phosphoprotein-like [Drosophila eugracilis]